MTFLSIVLHIFVVGTGIAMLTAVTRRHVPALARSAMVASTFGLLLAGRLAAAGDRRDLVFIVGTAIIFLGLAFQSWAATQPKEGDDA